MFLRKAALLTFLTHHMTRDLYQDEDDNGASGIQNDLQKDYREIDEDKDNTSDSRETCQKSKEVTAAGVTVAVAW